MKTTSAIAPIVPHVAPMKDAGDGNCIGTPGSEGARVRIEVTVVVGGGVVRIMGRGGGVCGYRMVVVIVGVFVGEIAARDCNGGVPGRVTVGIICAVLSRPMISREEIWSASLAIWL